MKTYLVGGAVRDQLMGRPVADRDWAVVGASPEHMVAAGFRQVGGDFPVFLHPETAEEYALARTERKGGPDFQWDPSVTLEQDLSRRDLTINAMARSEEGELIDPFGGQADIQAGVLRHVSDSFMEDPIRVLRVARFAARYQGFRVAEATVEVCRALVAAGALDDLVPERVWKELSRGLMEANPSVMFAVLRQSNALQVIFPELEALHDVPQPAAHHPEVDTLVHVMAALDLAATNAAPLEVRYAVLMHDLGKGRTPAEILPGHPDHEKLGIPLVRKVNKRFKVPTSMGHLAEVMCAEHTRVHRALELRETRIVQLLGRLDILRRPERLEWLLRACEFDARGRHGFEARKYPQSDRIRAAADAIRNVDAGAVAQACKEPSQIPIKLYEARVRAVKAALS